MKSKGPDKTAHVQDDVTLHNLHMLKGIFLLDAAQVKPAQGEWVFGITMLSTIFQQPYLSKHWDRHSEQTPCGI